MNVTPETKAAQLLSAFPKTPTLRLCRLRCRHFINLIFKYLPSLQITKTIRNHEISILDGNTVMDYDVIPVGHSLAFHFRGYNIRPFLEAQLVPYSTRLMPYYKSFVGLSDTSNFAAGFDSIKFTTRRAAAPSPIATGISQIIHATSTTFASPAEAVETPTPLPSQVVEQAANSNGRQRWTTPSGFVSSFTCSSYLPLWLD